jgi:hypothetical protein
MKSTDEPLNKKMDEDRDDATKPFSNAEKEGAAEINKAGDAKSRNYMNKEGEENEGGPDFNKKSKDVDGDSGQNAGVFK